MVGFDVMPRTPCAIIFASPPEVSRLRRMLSYQMLWPNACVWWSVVCLLAVIWGDPLASSALPHCRCLLDLQRRDLVDRARVAAPLEFSVQPGVDDRERFRLRDQTRPHA